MEMIVKQIVGFAATGDLKGLEIGDPWFKALRVLGPPDGETEGPDDKMYAFAGVQIGRSRSDVIWYIAIEPAGENVNLPVGLCDSGRGLTPRRDELLAALRDRGEVVIETQPYVPDETWWQVVGSGVLMDFDEDGLLSVVVKDDLALKS
ncbi:hypothetical protein AB0B89_17420 [Sphaerisporangium sp. NPDC049002]|uniref:hypothetical protein n=1 Tax=unclassified Sphaerisporangium TaxID=2630420 RepID=UPI0033CA77A0